MLFRRAQREPAAPRPRMAVITVVRDGGDMLARWVDYYGRQVGVENLIVFDDNSSDGSTRDLGCPVIHLPAAPWRLEFEQARMRLASGTAHALLACYDVVVFCDVDEFLVPDPAVHDSLPDFLAARAEHDIIAPVALNLVHRSDVESALDPSKPVLQQRSFVKFVPIMCKPAVKRVASPWRSASHGISAPFSVDPELFMIHLKFFDEEALLETGDHRRRMHELDGRAAKTTWTVGGAGLVEQLREWVAAPPDQPVPELDVRQLDLREVVQQVKPNVYKATGAGQLAAMANQPLLRLPPRFASAF